MIRLFLAAIFVTFVLLVPAHAQIYALESVGSCDSPSFKWTPQPRNTVNTVDPRLLAGPPPGPEHCWRWVTILPPAEVKKLVDDEGKARASEISKLEERLTKAAADAASKAVGNALDKAGKDMISREAAQYASQSVIETLAGQGAVVPKPEIEAAIKAQAICEILSRIGQKDLAKPGECLW